MKDYSDAIALFLHEKDSLVISKKLPENIKLLYVRTCVERLYLDGKITKDQLMTFNIKMDEVREIRKAPVVFTPQKENIDRSINAIKRFMATYSINVKDYDKRYPNQPLTVDAALSYLRKAKHPYLEVYNIYCEELKQEYLNEFDRLVNRLDNGENITILDYYLAIPLEPLYFKNLMNSKFHDRKYRKLIPIIFGSRGYNIERWDEYTEEMLVEFSVFDTNCEEISKEVKSAAISYLKGNNCRLYLPLFIEVIKRYSNNEISLDVEKVI